MEADCLIDNAIDATENMDHEKSSTDIQKDLIEMSDLQDEMSEGDENAKDLEEIPLSLKRTLSNSSLNEDLPAKLPRNNPKRPMNTSWSTAKILILRNTYLRDHRFDEERLNLPTITYIENPYDSLCDIAKMFKSTENYRQLLYDNDVVIISPFDWIVNDEFYSPLAMVYNENVNNRRKCISASMRITNVLKKVVRFHILNRKIFPHLKIIWLLPHPINYSRSKLAEGMNSEAYKSCVSINQYSVMMSIMKNMLKNDSKSLPFVSLMDHVVCANSFVNGKRHLKWKLEIEGERIGLGYPKKLEAILWDEIKNIFTLYDVDKGINMENKKKLAMHSKLHPFGKRVHEKNIRNEFLSFEEKRYWELLEIGMSPQLYDFLYEYFYFMSNASKKILMIRSSYMEGHTYKQKDFEKMPLPFFKYMDICPDYLCNPSEILSINQDLFDKFNVLVLSPFDALVNDDYFGPKAMFYVESKPLSYYTQFKRDFEKKVDEIFQDIIRYHYDYSTKFPHLKIIWTLPHPIKYDNIVLDDCMNSKEYKHSLFMNQVSVMMGIMMKWLTTYKMLQIPFVSLFYEQNSQFGGAFGNFRNYFLKMEGDRIGLGYSIPAQYCMLKQINDIVNLCNINVGRKCVQNHQGLKSNNFKKEFPFLMQENLQKFSEEFENFVSDNQEKMRAININPCLYDFTFDFNSFMVREKKDTFQEVTNAQDKSNFKEVQVPEDIKAGINHILQKWKATNTMESQMKEGKFRTKDYKKALTNSNENSKKLIQFPNKPSELNQSKKRKKNKKKKPSNSNSYSQRSSVPNGQYFKNVLITTSNPTNSLKYNQKPEKPQYSPLHTLNIMCECKEYVGHLAEQLMSLRDNSTKLEFQKEDSMTLFCEEDNRILIELCLGKLRKVSSSNLSSMDKFVVDSAYKAAQRLAEEIKVNSNLMTI